MRFKINDKSNKLFSDNVFTWFIIVLSNGELFIAGSKNSNGVILKCSQIFKNTGIGRELRKLRKEYMIEKW
jgi:hypothetical protein